MKIACLSCGHEYDVAEGSTLRGVKCPKCGTPPAAHFPHEKMLRFESVDCPAYSRACEHARRGEQDLAFAALEEAFRSGYDVVERSLSDRDLAGLRNDPRFADLLRRVRSK